MDRRQAWLFAGLISCALLVVPLLGWLLFPRPTPFVPPRRTTVAAAPRAPEPEAPEPERPRPAAPAAAPTEAPSDPVRGVVLDPDGNPIAGAFVSCKDRPEVSGSTDTEGKFELPPDADGCSAVATQAAYNPSEPTQLTSGRDNTLRLVKGGAIEGNVVDETGRAVPQFLVAVESFMPHGEDTKARFSRRPHVIDDPGGAFRIEDLPAGRYVLTASSAGRPPARSDGIDVEAGVTTRHARIVLPRGVTLVGTVIDAGSRRPIFEAQVELDAVTSSGANAISLVLTDAEGHYELEGVPANGPFSIRVRHQAYVTKIVPGLDARGSAGLRADVELRAAGDGGVHEELAGIGATLAPSPRGVVLVGVFEGGPAARAGLESGDRVVRIDGADATDLPMSDCVQRLRGPVGTRVAVGVDRAGRSIDVTIVREVVSR